MRCHRVMYKIGVIGKEEKIIFLKALGFEAFFIKKESDVEEVFKKIKEDGNFGIVFFEEDYFKIIKEERRKTKEDYPIMLALPESMDKKDSGEELKKIIKKAIGTDKIIIK